MLVDAMHAAHMCLRGTDTSREFVDSITQNGESNAVNAQADVSSLLMILASRLWRED